MELGFRSHEFTFCVDGMIYDIVVVLLGQLQNVMIPIEKGRQVNSLGLAAMMRCRHLLLHLMFTLIISPDLPSFSSQ